MLALGTGFGYSTNTLWGQDLVCNKLEFIQQYLARKKTPMLIRCHQKLHTIYSAQQERSLSYGGRLLEGAMQNNVTCATEYRTSKALKTTTL